MHSMISLVGAYYLKLKGLWEELSEFRPNHHNVCSGVNPLVDHIDREYVLTFLLGLHEYFNKISSQNHTHGSVAFY